MTLKFAIELMKSGTLIIDSIYEVDVLNAVPLREAMELLSILH